MSHHLTDLLEEGIREVRRGRTTPEEFLARHPAEAETLAPLLRLAARLDPHTAPAPSPQARARITARVRAGLNPTPVSRRLSATRRAWLAAAAFAALTLLSVSGTGLAARDALPGDALYGVKRAMERVEPVMRREDALDRSIRLSERRLGEVQALARRHDRTRLPTALAAYEREYLRLLQVAATAPPQPAERAVRHAAAQLTTLAALRGQEAGADPALAALVDRLGELTAGLVAVPTGAERQRAAAVSASPAPAEAPAPATPTGEPGAAAALRRAVDAAERAGVLASDQADELRRLLDAEAVRTDGSPSNPAAVVERLVAAIAACAERGCTDPATLTALHNAVAGGALALGLPQPPAPRPRTAATAHTDGSAAPPPAPRSSPQAAVPAPHPTVTAVGNTPAEAGARPTPPPTAAAPPREPPVAIASPPSPPLPTTAPPARATESAPTPARPSAAAAASPAAAAGAPAAPAAAPSGLAAATAPTATARPMAPSPSPTATTTPTPTATPADTPAAGR
jgi:hypothetical protein